MLQLDSQVAARRLLENSERSLSLSAEFTKQIQTLVKSAAEYDLETYRKADDEINDTLDKEDANYLETLMLLQIQELPEATRKEIESSLARIPNLLVESKMNCYKSSAIFYLCFGLPVQSARYSRLALSLVDSNQSLAGQKNELLYYLGLAELWSGNYKESEILLRNLADLNSGQKFAAAYLGETLIAEQSTDKAIEWLDKSLQTADSPETRGHLARLLAFAWKLKERPEIATQLAQRARQELKESSLMEYPAVALESLGIVNALDGEYRTASEQLSQALAALQDSPLKKGNKLEAAQCALWRSYCLEKLGEKSKADADRNYALSFNTEAAHLQTLASACDRIFKHKETAILPASVNERWALSVGISKFQDPLIPRLRYSSKDAKDLSAFLTTYAGFKADHIKTLLDSEATLAAITGNLGAEWLGPLVKPGDLVLLFISSHGTPSYKNIGVLNSVVSYDTKLDSLFSGSIPMQSLIRLLRRNFRNQYLLAILDTCYAGGLAAPGPTARQYSNLDPQFGIISRQQLLAASSDSTERSWESKRYPNSIFTRQFLEGLTENPSYTDFHPIFESIAENVKLEVAGDFKTTQTPRLAGAWSGKGILRQSSVKQSRGVQGK